MYVKEIYLFMCIIKKQTKEIYMLTITIIAILLLLIGGVIYSAVDDMKNDY